MHLACLQVRCRSDMKGGETSHATSRHFHDHFRIRETAARRILFRPLVVDRVSTPLGDFAVQLHLGIGDTGTPDQEMLTRMSDLVRYAEAHGDYILDLVFGYYLFAAEGADWLEMAGVPRGLSKPAVVN